MKKVNETLFFLGSTHFMIHVFSQILPAVLPVIRQEAGLSIHQAGLLVSIPLLVQVALYLPVGAASDRRGAYVLGLSFVAAAAGAVLITLARGFSVLVVGFALIALGSTMYHPPALKATSRVSGDRLGTAMGVQNAGGSLGYSAGPIILGLLLPIVGWRASIYLWLPLVLGAALYSYRYFTRLEPSTVGRQGWGGLRASLSVRLLATMIAGAFTDLTFVNVSTYITTYFTEVRGATAATSSIVFGLGPFLGIAGSVLGGWLGDRVGRRAGFTAYCIGMLVTVYMIPMASSMALASCLFIGWRALYSATMPLVNSLISLNSDMENRSLCFSVYFIVSSLMSAAAPLLASYLIEGWGLSMVFALSALTVLPSILLTWFMGAE
jgi:FSR family fosmidomycin resistance protein-like MFS transporter